MSLCFTTQISRCAYFSTNITEFKSHHLYYIVLYGMLRSTHKSIHSLSCTPHMLRPTSCQTFREHCQNCAHEQQKSILGNPESNDFEIGLDEKASKHNFQIITNSIQYYFFFTFRSTSKNDAPITVCKLSVKNQHLYCNKLFKPWPCVPKYSMQDILSQNH